jgi:hypothetical protein
MPWQCPFCAWTQDREVRGAYLLVAHLVDHAEQIGYGDLPFMTRLVTANRGSKWKMKDVEVGVLMIHEWLHGRRGNV